MGFYWRDFGGGNLRFLLFVFSPVLTFPKLLSFFHDTCDNLNGTSATVVQNRPDQQEVGREYFVPAGGQ